jgi:hypothetical protein
LFSIEIFCMQSSMMHQGPLGIAAAQAAIRSEYARCSDVKSSSAT